MSRFQDVINESARLPFLLLLAIPVYARTRIEQRKKEYCITDFFASVKAHIAIPDPDPAESIL